MGALERAITPTGGFGHASQQTVPCGEVRGGVTAKVDDRVKSAKHGWSHHLLPAAMPTALAPRVPVRLG